MMIRLRHWPVAVWTIIRTFGWCAGGYRAVFEFRRFTSRFAESPRIRLSGERGTALPLTIDARSLQKATNQRVALARADRVRAGEYEAFRWRWQPLPSSASAWVSHPGTGAIWDPHLPWWRIKHFDARRGDIKELWEPARFAWVYDLIRGYALTGDPDFGDAFRRHFSEWYAASPPFHGPHWACGQETAIRAIALTYAEANLPLSDELASTVEEVLAWSGERISDGVEYAISQRNNHGISEAAALIVLGVRLRDRHPEAQRWLKKGEKLLRRLVREQFAADGWYIQHSFNYLRVALDQCIVAERVLRSIGRGLPAEAAQRLRAAAALMMEVMESSNGIVPNHGANDGALVHPITTASYRDMRPVVTAVAALWDLPVPRDIQLDEEALVWLDVQPPERSAARTDGVVRGTSGWVAIRHHDISVFLRASRYSSRPGHIDGLHIDVRVSGHEVVVDPGTYSYAAPPPWRNGLAEAAVHNGPRLSAGSYELRGPRFLWYRWPSASIVLVAQDNTRITVKLKAKPGLERTVVVERTGVRVIDRAQPAQAFEVMWLLHPDAAGYALTVTGNVRRIDATEEDTAGWFSPLYGYKVPAVAIHTRTNGVFPAEVETFIPARQRAQPYSDSASSLYRLPPMKDGHARIDVIGGTRR